MLFLYVLLKWWETFCIFFIHTWNISLSPMCETGLNFVWDLMILCEIFSRPWFCVIISIFILWFCLLICCFILLFNHVYDSSLLFLVEPVLNMFVLSWTVPDTHEMNKSWSISASFNSLKVVNLEFCNICYIKIIASIMYMNVPI